ncbi:MAG TPA: hypothetical protein VLM37_05395 [Fibrobacteraceae bacterium]|nr:hypothetical protein [Fibrobacteraceae bacterium]
MKDDFMNYVFVIMMAVPTFLFAWNVQAEMDLLYTPQLNISFPTDSSIRFETGAFGRFDTTNLVPSQNEWVG